MLVQGQGCTVSPTLFILFSNEFIDMIKQTECRGIHNGNLLKKIATLLFGDDMVNAADSVFRLQQQTHSLCTFCNVYESLKLNMQNTQRLAF